VCLVRRDGDRTAQALGWAASTWRITGLLARRSGVLFPVLPIVGSMQCARSGRRPYAWESDEGAHVDAMKRSGSTSEASGFRAEAC
jgi:hypothetical protein